MLQRVLAWQTTDGAITLGDSREAATLVKLPDWRIAERWHGVYSLHPQKPFFEAEPAAGVRIVTAPSGSGMTLSFGLAERTGHWIEERI